MLYTGGKNYVRMCNILIDKNIYIFADDQNIYFSSIFGLDPWFLGHSFQTPWSFLKD